MNQHLLTGSCLCQRVQYSVAAELQEFYLCHCEQCRKVTRRSRFESSIGSHWPHDDNEIREFKHVTSGACEHLNYV
jgi:hypothetical protein